MLSKRLAGSLFFCVLMMQAFGQDLTGTWVGSASMSAYVELVIVRNGDSYVGYSYDRDVGYCQANFLGNYDTANQRLKGKGMGFIEKTFGHGQGIFNLKYSSNSGIDYLQGNVRPKTIAATMASLGMRTHVVLRRKTTKVDTTDFMRTALAGRVNSQSNKADGDIAATKRAEEAIINLKHQRQNDTLQTIVTAQKKIVLKLFDNGVEDNDSVSIIHNNKVVVQRQKITLVPFVFEIALDDADAEHEVTIIAHNLGLIPPNTAMVQIEAGSKTYYLTATSSLTKNAVIRFRYEPGSN